jgi:acyl carrier protein
MSAPFVREIKELLVSELDLSGRSADDIDENAPLFGEGLGLDSLDALQIAMSVEERFGVRIPEGKEAHPIFRSVATLAAYVAENGGRTS